MGHAEHAQALAEIERLQHAKSSWTNAVLLLAVSVALFFGAGAATWSMRTALFLIPILFFHELGHFLAMRLFHYRNVRMFFIPFLGAAVSGRHFNVPGWKKVVVSLLGPLPGILAGAVVGALALALDQKLLLEIALLMLILNGFNLLPLLPLDGGWVLHTILFCRHYLLDTAFRLVASCLLLAAGALAGDGVLIFLGVILLLALPTSYRVARIAAELRPKVVAVSPDDQSIPVETACSILDALKTSLPKTATPGTLANCTLQVFETLNTRPPGPWATAGFAALHVGSFLFAVVWAAVIAVAQQGGLGFAHQVAAMPKNSLDADAIQVWRGAGLRDDAAWAPRTVLANFADAAAAAQMFQFLKAELPPRSGLRLFGQTILIELPIDNSAIHAHWVKYLEPRCARVFVDGADSKVQMTVACFARDADAAADVAADGKGYLYVPAEALLIPPWSKLHELTPAQRKARRTFVKLQETPWLSADPSAKDLTAAITQAARRGDKQAFKELLAKQQALYRKERQRHAQKLRDEGPDNVDLKTIDLFVKRPDHDVGNDKLFDERLWSWHLLLGQHLGQLPNDKGSANLAETRFSARGGLVLQTGLLVRFDHLTWTRPAEGAPALIGWLRDRQCYGFKYEFREARPGPGGDD